MANDRMWTNRSGRQVPVPVLHVPDTEIVSLLRLQEDFVERGEHLSLLGVLLDVIDKGKRQVRNQWKNGDLSKNRRDFAKAVTPYMSNPGKYANEIAQLAKVHGLTNGTAVDLSDPESSDEPEAEPAPESIEELTEQELEAATSPEKAN
jgi:hypothetical protein